MIFLTECLLCRYYSNRFWLKQMFDVSALQLLGCANEITASCYNVSGKLRSLVDKLSMF